MGGKKEMPIRAKVKITNKWVNKMTKRGKLRKGDRAKMLPHQKNFVQKITRQDDQLHADLNTNRYKTEFDTDSDDFPLDMMDSDDELLTKQPKMKKKKFNESESDDDDDTDPNRKYFGQDPSANWKHLLPIKTAAGRLVPMTIKEDEQLEEGGTAEQDPVPAENDQQVQQEPLNAAELFAKRSHLLEENKESIAAMCRMLVENPENNVHKLKDLLTRARGFVDPLVQFTVQKLATASLLEVFLDILPSYKIRQLSEKEETQQMKKETKHLHEYEETLLRNYQKYLQHLESLCKYYQTKKLRQNGVQVPKNIAEVMAFLGLKSFCRLLEEHPNFNYRTNILTVLVPLMSHKFEEVRKLVCETMETCFKSDKLGEFSFDAVRSICDFNKNNSFKSHPRMMETFLSLKIKEVEKKPEGMSVKQKIQAKKNRLKLMSRKEKKFKKRMDKLDVEMKEIEAQENTQTVLKMHTQIMNKIFATYFRILKQNKSRVELLAPVLEGLAKFAHMINVEFFDDLIKSLFNLIIVGELKPLESLHCTKTVFIILSGEGQSLTVDPQGFYRHVYSLLPKIVKQQESEMFSRQFPLCLECLDAMINSRRKQVALHRVAAFVKRMAILSHKLPAPAAAAILSAIRSYFLAHPKLDGLLDTETVGSGKYMKDLDDPDRCNALTTDILEEMDSFRTHDDPTVRQLASHIRNGIPSDGPHRISTEISGTQPWVLFGRMMEASEISTDANSLGSKNKSNSKRKWQGVK